jgi:hypothetical protein
MRLSVKYAGASARSAAAANAARGLPNIERAAAYISSTPRMPAIADGSRTLVSDRGTTFRSSAVA